MATIKELVDRKEAAEAELAAVNAEIAARHGETDDAPAEAEAEAEAGQDAEEAGEEA